MVIIYKVKDHFKISCKLSILLKDMKRFARFFIKKCTPQKEQNFHYYHTNGLTWKIKQRDFHQKSHTCRLPNKIFSTRFVLTYVVKKGGKESKNQHVQRRPDETDDNLSIAAIRQ